MSTYPHLPRVLSQLENHPEITVSYDESLQSHTTLRIGGKPLAFVTARSVDAITTALSICDNAQKTDGEVAPLPVMILGGGSNIVVEDQPLPYVIIKLLNSDIVFNKDDTVTCGAGTVFDDLIHETVEHDFLNLACFSGIPGSAGAAPVQNVGAYGGEVSRELHSVFVYNRNTGETTTLMASDLGFAYRYSNLKYQNRIIVLQATFKVHNDTRRFSLQSQELAKRLSNLPSQYFSGKEIRKEVLRLRGEKGMLLDDTDTDTFSVGSFFTNPIIEDPERIRKLVAAEVGWDIANQMKVYPSDQANSYKLAAAWLIEKAGFEKGYTHGHAALSSKHTLAIVNKDSASYREIIELACIIKNGVLRKFNVELTPEPIFYPPLSAQDPLHPDYRD